MPTYPFRDIPIVAPATFLQGAVRWVQCGVLFGGLFLGAVAADAAHAQADQIATLNQRVVELWRDGKYVLAIPLAVKALELTRAEKGEGHLETASWMTRLAFL